MSEINFLLTAHIEGDVEDIPTLKENILAALERTRSNDGISSDKEAHGYVMGFSARHIDT
jgi:hypothetical protein